MYSVPVYNLFDGVLKSEHIIIIMQYKIEFAVSNKFVGLLLCFLFWQ